MAVGDSMYRHIGCGMRCASPHRSHLYRKAARPPSAHASHVSLVARVRRHTRHARSGADANAPARSSRTIAARHRGHAPTPSESIRIKISTHSTQNCVVDAAERAPQHGNRASDASSTLS
jgi:hypothetical protein